MVADRYHLGIGAYGLALGAFGLGNLAGNLLSARLGDRNLLRWCAVAWALAGVGFLAVAGAPDFPLFLLGSAALGVCTPLANVTVDVHIAKTLPGHVLARAYAAQRFVVVAAGALGLPVVAILIHRIGANATIAVSGIVITAVATGALLVHPRPVLRTRPRARPSRARSWRPEAPCACTGPRAPGRLDVEGEGDRFDVVAVGLVTKSFPWALVNTPVPPTTRPCAPLSVASVVAVMNRSPDPGKIATPVQWPTAVGLWFGKVQVTAS